MKYVIVALLTLTSVAALAQSYSASDLPDEELKVEVRSGKSKEQLLQEQHEIQILQLQAQALRDANEAFGAAANSWNGYFGTGQQGAPKARRTATICRNVFGELQCEAVSQ